VNVLSGPGDSVRPVAVLGMGNVLLSDDGAGPAVVARIEAEMEIPEDLEVADIGTPGLDLVPHLAGRRAVILVDTVAAEGAPGELRLYGREDLASALRTNRLSPHDPGLAESLATLELAGEGPEFIAVVGIIPADTKTGIGLSAPVEEAVGEAALEVLRLLEDEVGITLSMRAEKRRPRSWLDRE